MGNSGMAEKLFTLWGDDVLFFVLEDYVPCVYNAGKPCKKTKKNTQEKLRMAPFDNSNGHKREEDCQNQQQCCSCATHYDISSVSYVLI